jgi:phospholipid/cholesterol/gamma-HCH transport system permease protein
MRRKLFEITLNFLNETGALLLFLKKFLGQLFAAPFEIKEIVNQCYSIGYKTLALVGITAFIIGAVLTIQTRPTLAEFGASSWLPSMVAVSIVREIGPVVAALICAGKIGSGIAAELGSMRVTQQIDAMEVAGINPFKYLVGTRVWATTLMIPLLIIWADTIALYGSYIAVNLKEEVSFRLFNHQVFSKLTYTDLLPAFIKSYFFGLSIGAIASFYGYHAKGGTTGVGRACNTAVVVSSLAIFIIDLFAAQLMDIIMR